MTSYQYKTENISILGEEFSLKLFADFEKTLDQFIDNMDEDDLDFTAANVPLYGTIWPSAIALATFLKEECKDEIRGKKVLEIGCGLGLPGFMAAKLQGQVTSTDYHEEVEDLFNRNKELNQLTNINYASLDLRNEDGSRFSNFDFIIGSDILYEQNYYDDFIRFLNRASTTKTKIILSDPQRTHLENFVTKCKSEGFSIERCAKELPATEKSEKISIAILKIKKIK